MSQMIPLHIADQAVAACEKEIQELRAENARLVKRLDDLLQSIAWLNAEPENGVTRFSSGMDEDMGGSLSCLMEPDKEGEWVTWLAYARLLEEKSGWEAEMDLTLDYLAAARNEVERLRASSFVTAVPVEQYERLLKAGDRMAAALNGEYNHELPCVEEWTAAKEGKQP